MRTPAEDVARFLKDSGWTQKRLASELGLEQPTISRWLSGSKTNALTWNAFIEITRRFYAGRSGESEGDSEVSPRTVLVAAAVQAGDWKLVEELSLDPAERFSIEVPEDPRYPRASRFGCLVRGPSMNEVFPDGTILVCIHPILLRQDPAQGDYVIVQRIDDTSQGELTVKQYALDDEGRPYLWPRSSHPDHQQPIRFPDADEFDQRNDIQVTGIVIGSYRLEGSMNPVRREA